MTRAPFTHPCLVSPLSSDDPLFLVSRKIDVGCATASAMAYPRANYRCRSHRCHTYFHHRRCETTHDRRTEGLLSDEVVDGHTPEAHQGEGRGEAFPGSWDTKDRSNKGRAVFWNVRHDRPPMDVYRPGRQHPFDIVIGRGIFRHVVVPTTIRHPNPGFDASAKGSARIVHPRRDRHSSPPPIPYP